MIHKDHHGKTSMMRVGLAVTLAVGAILCLGGTTALFMGLDGDSLVLAGSGMMTTSSWAKAIQKKWESDNVG